MIFLPYEIRGCIANINGATFWFAKHRSQPYSSESVTSQKLQLKIGENYFQNGQAEDFVSYHWMLRVQKEWSSELQKEVKRGLKEHQSSLQASVDAWLDAIDRESGQSQYVYYSAAEIPGKVGMKQFLMRHTPLIIPEAFTSRLTDRKMEQYMNQFYQQTKNLRVKPLEEWEIEDFYLDHNYAGLPRMDSKQYYEQFGKKEFRRDRLMPNKITPLHPSNGEHGPCIRIQSDKGVRYMTFLTITMFPRQIWSPSFDLFHDLQMTGLNVEACARVVHKTPEQAKKWSDWKRRTSESNYEHAQEAQQEAAKDFQTVQRAHRQEQEAWSQNRALNKVNVIFKLISEDPFTLDEQASFLEKNILRNLKGVEVLRPVDQQSRLYDAWLPAPYWSGKGHTHEIYPNRTAAIVTLGAADALGDPTGMPIGFLDSNRSVVRMDIPRGAESNASSNIILIGPTGSGKTHLVGMMIADLLRGTKSRVIIGDQKGEHKKWVENSPFGLSDMAQYISLDGYQNPGVLDPFHLIRLVNDEDIGGMDPDEYREQIQRSLANKMINVIQDFRDNANRYLYENAINSAMDRAKEKGSLTMADIVEELLQDENPEVYQFARSLERKSRMPMGKLIFGRPIPGRELVFPETGLIVLGLNTQLSLPQGGQPANEEESLSLAVLAGLNAINEQFLLEGKEKGVFSLKFSDDSSFSTDNDINAELDDRIFRLGRSKFCGNILATQNPSDPPRKLLNNTHRYICLGVKNPEEIPQAMTDLGVEPDNMAVYEKLKDLGKTQAQEYMDEEDIEERTESYGYYSDLYGRVGLVRFVTPQTEMLQFLKTTQTRQSESEGEDKKEVAQVDDRLLV